MCAGGGLVDGEDGAEHTETLGGGGSDGNTEPSTDRLGDRTHRVCFVAHRVQHRAGRGLFERQPETAQPWYG